MFVLNIVISRHTPQQDLRTQDPVRYGIACGSSISFLRFGWKGTLCRFLGRNPILSDVCYLERAVRTLADFDRNRNIFAASVNMIFLLVRYLQNDCSLLALVELLGTAFRFHEGYRNEGILGTRVVISPVPVNVILVI